MIEANLAVDAYSQQNFSPHSMCVSQSVTAHTLRICTFRLPICLSVMSSGPLSRDPEYFGMF